MKIYIKPTYWVSAIIQDKTDFRPWLCSMDTAELSVEDALVVIGNLIKDHTVLSAWIDLYDNGNERQTVFHECYINALGNVKEASINDGPENA